MKFAFSILFFFLFVCDLQAVFLTANVGPYSSGSLGTVQRRVYVNREPGGPTAHYKLTAGGTWLSMSTSGQTLYVPTATGTYSGLTSAGMSGDFAMSPAANGNQVWIRVGGTGGVETYYALEPIPVVYTVTRNVSGGSGVANYTLPDPVFHIYINADGSVTEQTYTLTLNTETTVSTVPLIAWKETVDGIVGQIDSWNAPLGSDSKNFSGFQRNETFMLQRGDQIIAMHTFSGVEGGNPIDFTINLPLEGDPPPPDPDPETPPDYDFDPGDTLQTDPTPPPPAPTDPPTPPPPTDPPSPPPVTPPVVHQDTTTQVIELDTAAREQRAEMIGLLSSIEEMQRTETDRQNTTRTDAQNLGTYAMDNLPDDPTSTYLQSRMPGIMDKVVGDVNRPTAALALPTDSAVAAPSSWVVNLGLGANRSYLVDLNPLTNPKTAPFLSALGDWCKAIIMGIVIITGTSMLYERYYESFRDLCAARGGFFFGITAPVSIADIVTGVAGAVAAVYAGTMTFGAGAAAVGGIVASALSKFVIPIFIHIGFLAVVLAPALASIAMQGLISTLPFSTTNTSAAPGSGLTGSLLDSVIGLPSFATNGLAIIAAFVPIAFVVTYWISYLVTARLLRTTTSFAMIAQSILGKS